MSRPTSRESNHNLELKVSIFHAFTNCPMVGPGVWWGGLSGVGVGEFRRFIFDLSSSDPPKGLTAVPRMELIK